MPVVRKLVGARGPAIDRLFWFQIEILEDLAYEFESNINRKFKKLKSENQELDRIRDTQHKEYLREGLVEDYYLYQEWTNIIRESLLISLCSSFEYYLVSYCEYFALEHGLKKKIKDVKGRGIRACRRLFCEAGIDDKAFGKPWNSLIILYEARNKIVHAGGKVDEETKKLVNKENSIFVTLQEHEFKLKLKPDSIEQICILMSKVVTAIRD